jgi:putative transposase
MNPDTEPTQASWELPEAVWQRMEPLIPPRKSQEGRPQTVDLKRITAGIFSVLRTGSQWHACPRQRFGPPRTVYYDFRPWGTAGVFGHLWAVALTVYDELKGLEWTWQSVDGAMTTAPLGGRPRAPIPRTVARAGRSAAC